MSTRERVAQARTAIEANDVNTAVSCLVAVALEDRSTGAVPLDARMRFWEVVGLVERAGGLEELRARLRGAS